MKIKHLFTIIVFLFVTGLCAQSNLNNYRYVILPKKFDFLKEEDKYQLNSLTKFLLEKEGFTVLFDGDTLPLELSNNRCSAIYADVLNESKLLKIKLKLTLKDCSNNLVFETEVGESKSKDYKKGYHEALREAFQSFKSVNYQYQPNKEEVELVEVKPMTQTKKEVPKPEAPETPKPEDIKPKPAKTVLREKEKTKKEIIEKPKKIKADSKEELTAQWFGLGFKVLDSNSNEVMVLYMTAKEEVYIVKGKDAIVCKNENGFWVYSENDGNNLQAKVLNLKF